MRYFNQAGCKIFSCKVLILVCFFSSFCFIQAMGSLVQYPHISIKKANVTLESVLEDISVRSAYSIIIRNNDVDLSQKVSVIIIDNSPSIPKMYIRDLLKSQEL